MKSLFSSAILLAAAATFTATAADAKIYKFKTRTTNVNLTAANGTATLPLTDGGATTATFSLASARRVAITYSAECGVNGGYWGITILVDNVEYAPLAGTDDAFCFGGFGMFSGTIAPVLKKGTHTVVVKAYPHAGAGNSNLDDTSLIIHD